MEFYDERVFLLSRGDGFGDEDGGVDGVVVDDFVGGLGGMELGEFGGLRF